MARRMTKAEKVETARWLLNRVADAHRGWKPGDECMAYRGDARTTVVRVEGEIVHLANGEAMHHSKMRSVR